MRNHEVIRYQTRLDSLFEKVKNIQDFELQAEWAKYLCVLVSGYLETAIRAIYSEYARNKANKNVANFVSSRLSGFQNPNVDMILQRARAFSPIWADELESVLNTRDELKNSVNSIVTNRNHIAHGENVGITYTTIYKYYQNAIKVMEMIENQCYTSK